MTSGVPVQVRSYFCCWDIASQDSLVNTLTTEKSTNPLCLPRLSYSHLQALMTYLSPITAWYRYRPILCDCQCNVSDHESNSLILFMRTYVYGVSITRGPETIGWPVAAIVCWCDRHGQTDRQLHLSSTGSHTALVNLRCVCLSLAIYIM